MENAKGKRIKRWFYEMTGTVKNITVSRAFGFIRAGNKDYFFHRDDVGESWDMLVDKYERKDVVHVEFDPTESRKGPRAENVIVTL